MDLGVSAPTPKVNDDFTLIFLTLWFYPRYFQTKQLFAPTCNTIWTIETKWQKKKKKMNPDQKDSNAPEKVSSFNHSNRRMGVNASGTIAT